VLEHAVDGVEVLFAFIAKALRLGLELLESALRVDVDGIFCVLAKVEFYFELLRCLQRCQQSG
jgi:hypothetical protein